MTAQHPVGTRTPGGSTGYSPIEIFVGRQIKRKASGTFESTFVRRKTNGTFVEMALKRKVPYR